MKYRRLLNVVLDAQRSGAGAEDQPVITWPYFERLSFFKGHDGRKTVCVCVSLARAAYTAHVCECYGVQSAVSSHFRLELEISGAYVAVGRDRRDELSEIILTLTALLVVHISVC